MQCACCGKDLSEHEQVYRVSLEKRASLENRDNTLRSPSTFQVPAVPGTTVFLCDLACVSTWSNDKVKENFTRFVTGGQ